MAVTFEGDFAHYEQLFRIEHPDVDSKVRVWGEGLIYYWTFNSRLNRVPYNLLKSKLGRSILAVKVAQRDQ